MVLIKCDLFLSALLKIKSNSFIMKSFTIIIFSLLISFKPASAQNDNEKQILEKIGQYFADAVNNPSFEKLKELIPEIFTVKDTTKETLEIYSKKFKELKQESGGVILHSVRITENGIHVIAQQIKTRLWKDYQLIRNHSDNKVNGIFIADITEPTEIPHSSITDAKSLKWLSDYINKLSEQYDFSGSILIAKDGKEFFSKYFGLADRKAKTLIDQQTKFNLASGNKVFTAVSIFQLIQQNKLSLQDHLEKFLPDYPDAKFTKDVTIQELLTHTSGLGDYWDDEFEKSWDTIKTLSQYLPFITMQKLNFEPGKGVLYSNSAYILLGLIIEKISGKSYFDYVKENIFNPAGMKNTGFFLRNLQLKDLAIPYTEDSMGKRWIKSNELPLYGSSAGGGYSTGEDILKLYNALNNYLLLNKKFTQLMLSDQVSIPGTKNRKYAFGFEINYLSNHRVVGKGGLAPGVNFYLGNDEKNKISVVIFCNQDNSAFDDLKKNILELITKTDK
jgi:CubicO group peptidase (beta-lactamase class C family)